MYMYIHVYVSRLSGLSCLSDLLLYIYIYICDVSLVCMLYKCLGCLSFQTSNIAIVVSHALDFHVVANVQCV